MFPNSTVYYNIILYLISPRFDNLLLKTFGVSAEVPHFSFAHFLPNVVPTTTTLYIGFFFLAEQ